MRPDATMVAVAALSMAWVASLSQAAPEGVWKPGAGRWLHTREIIPILRQADGAGAAEALYAETLGEQGVWRATVQPSSRRGDCGLLLRPSASTHHGILAVLGGNPQVGGFTLKTVAGEVLWQDKWAPWGAYEPFAVELIVEPGRVRTQMLCADRETLVSQSPWVDLPQTMAPGAVSCGLYTGDAIARFWRWQVAQEPLSPVVENPPNKLRLVQEDDSPWAIVGPGSWMWTDGTHKRLHQKATVERTSAIDRRITGGPRLWECALRVEPGCGGAGMLVQTNDSATEGFIAWLGGQHGAGSLMLYQLPLTCLWSGEQDNWHYDTDYVLRAETQKGKIRAWLLEADGETVIQQTPWIEAPLAASATEGCMGLQTWLGTAQFWGFSEGTQAAPTAVVAQAQAKQLGNGWIAVQGAGQQWTSDDSVALRLTGDGPQVALNTGIAGIMGTWRCRVTIADASATAGMLFQADRDLKQGFACLLTPDGLRLEDTSGKKLWDDPNCAWSTDSEYLLEGNVMVDRVGVRLLAADGQTVLSECPAVYVPEANNDRTGHLGVVIKSGSATFSGWELQ